MSLTLIVTVGLPRSGKTTGRKKYPTAAYVNRDSIRLAATGHVFRQESETIVTAIEEQMVRSLMLAETETIYVDATNTIPSFRNKWRKLASQYRYKIVFECFKTPFDECCFRAGLDKRLDLIPIITKMSQYCTFPTEEQCYSLELEVEVL